MRAILLAAGLGARISALTSLLPKCLLPVAGQPLLQRWFESLDAVGVDRFLINAHHLPEQIQAFVATSPFADRVEIVHEERLLGTGETVRRNLSFLDGRDGFILHADNCMEGTLSDLLSAHLGRPTGCVATMLMFNSADLSVCGAPVLDERGVVIDYAHKPLEGGEGPANAAVYVVAPDFTAATDPLWPAADFSADLIPQLIGRLHTHLHEGGYFDIGTPASFLRANLPADLRDLVGARDADAGGVLLQ